MRKSCVAAPSGPAPLLPLPRWIGALPAAAPEQAAFRAGAALAHLQPLVASPDIPQALWRARLAVAAAESGMGLAGWRAAAPALRDALYLTRPGDDPGHAGRILRQWLRAVARPISGVGLAMALDGMLPDDRIARCLAAAGGSPVDRASQALETGLAEGPHAAAAALLLADAVLAQAMGWKHVLPLIAPTMAPRMLRLRGDDLRLACHRAVVRGAERAVPLAADLQHRAARLQAVLPQLRAKGAARATGLFLTCDVLAPAALDFMSDRAARRLCDRLLALGVLREWTGRNAFRLYGL